MADEGLTAGAVARRLGVAVTTLRTWHQRYGLGPSEHVPGHHRRYNTEDLDRLEVMRRLTNQGVAPAEAAAWARRTPPPAEFAFVGGGFLGGGAPAGGGHTIALGPATPAARGLARAAMRLDAGAMRDILETVVAEQGVIGAWSDVMMPVLIGIGERYHATKRFIEVEHLVSRAVTEVLGAIPRPGDTARVLLAAADEEQHTLPLEALAAALAEAGVPTRFLGPRVPPPALAEAIARTGPAVVVVWSQLPSTGDPGQLILISDLPHPPLMIAAAGPGWPGHLPAAVLRLSALDQAVETVRVAVTPA
ncbi:MerR family transcriptional regulator [Actinoplanes sp. TBRC 11911]|uniref:MerR family transcriptional regulator n=1 Tax=Actinoplanes sp. TBRC 11911 TaxID=2729386 RepID=UPI00145DFAFC|nr:MerR family transcriptional regulator [Actinoplanes sp. TBRC 11911]NMO57508.1 MerR family transcriptional regulator [Actinoplanes sp. TBRC 11911]